jgi:hypothetical protein
MTEPDVSRSFDGSRKGCPKTRRSEVAKGAKLPRHQAPTDIENIHGHRFGFKTLKDNFELPGLDCCRKLEREGAHNANPQNQQEVTVPGRHHLQEDSPREIAQAIVSWLASIENLPLQAVANA